MEWSFIELKDKVTNKLTSPSVLTQPNFEKKFTLVADASGERLGAVFEQEGRRDVHTIIVGHLLETRRILTIKWAINNYRCYLLEERLIVTRHRPKLSEYDFKITYKLGF